MKNLILNLLFFTFTFTLNAQWVQTNLNSSIGYSLFSDNTTIYASTAMGVYYTNDVGDPWFSIGPEDWIFSVITSGNNIVAGSGASNGIWVTSDLGQNWSHGSGMDNESVNIFCKNDSYLFAGTWGSGVFRSGDSGNSWQKVGLDGEPVEALLSLADTIFAGGEDINGGKIYFSTDSGENWDYRYLPYPAFRVYCFTYKDGKVYAGTDGGLYSSSDLGDSWNLEYGATFDSYGNVIDTKFFTSLIAYDKYLIAAIMFNSIWISSDGGKVWTNFSEGLISDWTFYGLVVKDSNVWSLTENFGNAYRRPLTDLITSIQTEVVTVPNEYVLKQNYPNPFNPSTTINYSLPKQSNLTLKVFDALGRELSILVNKEQPQGNYKIEYNAKNLPSGIYFYRLKAGEYTQTKKMLMMK